MTKRSWPRIASATAVRSLAVVWGELIDQLRHAHAALDRRIVLEGQLGRSLHSELLRESRLKHGVRRLKPGKCLRLFSLRPEDGDEDARMAEIGGRLNAGHGHEADPRILELPNRLREDLADRLVDATHAMGHARYSTA